VTPGAPTWLTPADVLVLHDRLLHEHGGAAGVRDMGRLEAALARPQHHFAYGESDPFRLATAYASGITRNHPFVDGNKRTAFLAAFVFLAVNGQDLRADEAEVVHTMLALVDRTVSEEEFAGWLRANCVPRAEKMKTKRPRRRPRKGE
jgi:death-on-curing protein